MNRNDDVNVTALLLKVVTRRIDYSIQKTVRDIKAIHEVRSLLHIGGHKWQPFLELRVSLAGWPHHVLEEFVGWLARVSVEGHRVQHKPRTFRDVQAQSVRRFDHIVHVHFRVAVFSVKNFEEEGQIVRPSGT